MPNSRKRRRDSGRGPRRSGHPGRSGISNRDLYARAVADLPLLQATDAAEARGDALAALQMIERDLARRGEPNFWRPDRLTRLLQLGIFGPSLPRWVTSRWILAQAAQHLDPRTRGRGTKAIDIAVETRGGAATLVGTNAMDARAKVMDHDWVYRQVWLYELGALEHFVSRVASPDLLAGADHLSDWVRAPMAAFRLVGETPRVITMVDLATDRPVEALNIGSATLLEAGECAIGRLVPIDEGAMFESAPLYVPDEVAHQVVEDPPDWIAAVAAGCRRSGSDGSPGLSTHVLEFATLTDVPRAVALELVNDVTEQLSGKPLAIDASPEDVERAEATCIRAALEDRLPDTWWDVKAWPLVGAMLLSPGAFVELASSLTPRDRSRLLRLADRLAGPAGTLCHELALDLDSAA